MNQRKVEIIPITGLPEFKKADNLIKILIAALHDLGETLEDRDVLVVTQKIISKIEDRAINLDRVDISKILKNQNYIIKVFFSRYLLDAKHNSKLSIIKKFKNLLMNGILVEKAKTITMMSIKAF